MTAMEYLVELNFPDNRWAYHCNMKMPHNKFVWAAISVAAINMTNAQQEYTFILGGKK
jgi:hypothetical protein